MRAASFQPGFALIEALVALVLLAVALAGSAVLLVQAVHHERNAGERSRALRHVASLAEVLRALARADGQPLQAVADPAAVPSCVDYAQDCLAESQARQQIDGWHVAVAGDMPAGVAAEVAWAPDPSAAYAIAVSWPASGGVFDNAVRLLVEP
jgi:prepilin-type N-terminal cleavage/methylation domain-containing protein